jgi:hypothetical protein
MIAHVINLPHRTDRRKSVLRETERMGFDCSFIDAPRVPGDGYLGCALGHFYAVKELQKRPGPAYAKMVLEDDAIFTEPRETLNTCIAKFLEARADNWDALFLGSFYTGYFDCEKDRFLKPLAMNQTTAYIINDRFIPDWLEYLSQCVARRLSPGGEAGVIDQDWHSHLLRTKEIFCTNPKLVTQADDYSDIRKALVYGGAYKALNQ